MKPRLLLLETAAALTCLAPAIHTPVRADVRRPPSLTALVGRNALTRDTNGDGLPDSVAARVIVPSAPALADIEAGTNLAARLGYDTGEWLNLVAKAGFSYLMANVKYLRDGQYSVHRIEEDATRDAVSLTTIRVRPVLPGKTAPAAHATTSSTGGK